MRKAKRAFPREGFLATARSTNQLGPPPPGPAGVVIRRQQGREDNSGALNTRAAEEKLLRDVESEAVSIDKLIAELPRQEREKFVGFVRAMATTLREHSVESILDRKHKTLQVPEDAVINITLPGADNPSRSTE